MHLGLCQHHIWQFLIEHQQVQVWDKASGGLMGWSSQCPPCSAPCLAEHPAQGNVGALQGKECPGPTWGTWSSLPPQPSAECQDSSLHKENNPSYHPVPATRLSRRRGDVPSPLYFTSLEPWFESSSSMSSQRHTAAGHGDESLLCWSWTLYY